MGAIQVQIAQGDANSSDVAILDSGATGHVVNDMRLFENWEKDNSVIRTANGQRIGSTAIGTVRLPLAGDVDAILILREARYAPLNFNVVSMSV